MIISIDLEAFMSAFDANYAHLYRNHDHVAGYREAVTAFDDFVEKHTEFVCRFVDARGDSITSDREAAAFMFALESVEPFALKRYIFE